MKASRDYLLVDRHDEELHSFLGIGALSIPELVSFISGYGQSCLESSNYLMKNDFKESSYTAWACDEIVKAILLCPDEDPLIIISEFISKMDELWTDTEFTGDGDMFGVGYATALDILDELSTYPDFLEKCSRD